MRRKITVIVLFFVLMGLSSSVVFLILNQNKEFLTMRAEGEARTPWGMFTLNGEKKGIHTTIILSGNLGKATFDITSDKGIINIVLSGFEANELIYDYKSQKMQTIISEHISKSITIDDVIKKNYKKTTSSRYGNKLFLSGSIEAPPLLGKHKIGYRGGLQSYCIPYLEISGIGRYCFVYGHIDLSMNDILLKRSTIAGKVRQF